MNDINSEAYFCVFTRFPYVTIVFLKEYTSHSVQASTAQTDSCSRVNPMLPRELTALVSLLADFPTLPPTALRLDYPLHSKYMRRVYSA